MNQARKTGRKCERCNQTKPATQFGRSKAGFIMMRCKECAAIPDAKINIDRNLAAQFLGTNLNNRQLNSYYDFADESRKKHGESYHKGKSC